MTISAKNGHATTVALNHVLAQQYYATISDRQRQFNPNSLGGLVLCPGLKKTVGVTIASLSTVLQGRTFVIQKLFGGGSHPFLFYCLVQKHKMQPNHLRFVVPIVISYFMLPVSFKQAVGFLNANPICVGSSPTLKNYASPV